jgi:DnaJ-class molecular chaperone
VNSSVDYTAALSPGQKKLALSLLPKESICRLCDGVGVRLKKVCEDCHGSGLEGEYERVHNQRTSQR